MRKVIIIRDKIGRKSSHGVCLVQDENRKIIFSSQSLELGWLNNQRNISCIPAGKYDLKLEWSPKFKKKLWEIYGVPNRTECKFHAANYSYQLNGCIALGRNRGDINADGILDVTHSRDTMKKFHKSMEGHTEAIVHVMNSQES